MSYYPRIKNINPIKRARVIYERINKGAKLSLDSWNTVFRLFNTYDKAKIWFNRLKKIYKPSIITYNCMFKQCQNLDNCYQLYVEMKNNNVIPDIISYSTVLSKCKDKLECDIITEDMKIDGIKHNKVTANILYKKY